MLTVYVAATMAVIFKYIAWPFGYYLQGENEFSFKSIFGLSKDLTCPVFTLFFVAIIIYFSAVKLPIKWAKIRYVYQQSSAFILLMGLLLLAAREFKRAGMDGNQVEDIMSHKSQGVGLICLGWILIMRFILYSPKPQSLSSPQQP